MKILFFSDAHGNQYTIRVLVKKIQDIRPELVVFGGDIFGYYYGQKEIMSLLQKQDCICLLGNHDQYFLELYDGQKDIEYLIGRYGSTYGVCLKEVGLDDIDFLRGLKDRYDIKLDGLNLAFVHGSLDNPLEGRIYPDTEIEDLSRYNGIDYVFCGHTHHKLVKEFINGTTLINPGSIGQQRDGRGCTYVLFDTVTRSIEFQEIDYDRHTLVEEIRSRHEAPEMEQKLIEVVFREKRGDSLAWKMF